VLSEARDINDDGVIVGWGTLRGSTVTETRGFLLNPILVDPAVFEQDEGDVDTGTDTSTPTGGTGTGGPDYSNQPDFNPPDNVPAGSGDQAADGTTTTPTTPMALCGGGTLAALPLMLAGLCWLRFGRRSR